MANTWNGMISDNIAQMGLSTLEKRLVPIAGFSLDLSTDILTQGNTVSTRIVPAAASTVDIANDKSGAYDDIVSGKTTTSVQVTLNQQPANGFYLTDKQAQEIAMGVWSDTSQRLVTSHVRGIADNVLKKAFELVTNSNYGAASKTVSAANFDEDDVADLRKTAVDAGMDPDDMVLVLNPDYYTALLKSAAIKDYSASQSDALRSGELPRLNGFRVIEAPTLPDNSENLVGFAAQSDAMCIAMRGVDTQDRGQFLSYQILQDDSVGSVLTYSALWTPKYRQVEHIFEAYFGVQKANENALLRITSE